MNLASKLDLREITLTNNHMARIGDDDLEEMFWNHFPHEISFDELKEINPLLYKNMVRVALMLDKRGGINTFMNHITQE